jgi:hypothetical protein
MEYNENPNENEEMENEDEDQEGGTMKQWFQDNLRIIVSVAIVVIIAAGIYSYSNRSIAPGTTDQSDQTLSQNTDNTATSEGNTDQNTATTPATKDTTKDTTKDQTQNTQAKPQTTDKVSSTATSQETENSFVESASRGDGTTKLARRALANYLEKNPDSALTAEHKIYIEDFLRKNVSPKGRVTVGQSVEFSKDLIQKAISGSKNLNERQLKNLHKYAVRVPSLS